MEGSAPPLPPPPPTPFGTEGLHKNGDLVWAPLRGWIDVRHKPEEIVRQLWIRRLHVDGGFSLDQIDQERRTQSGRRSPRADIIVWRSSSDMNEGREPVLVIETKAGEGMIRPADFWQSESYGRAAGARFLILANSANHMTFELTRGFPGRARQIGTWPDSSVIMDEGRLLELVNRLEVFDREHFQRVLFECHSLLRDNHAMTPDRAFDTISKVLFIKLHVERSQTYETFTTQYLHDAARFFTNPRLSLHEQMFDQTKEAYAVDDLFERDDRLGISGETFRQIVGKLERFNLSKTSEDVKGIAFEKFLGRTFRGELGQFFTPRPIVDFIVNALDPVEGETVCDPAAGSGGFLIRVFDHVREKIAEDVAADRQRLIDAIAAEYQNSADDDALDERDRRIEVAVSELNQQLLPNEPDGGPKDTRVGRLAWNCLYGADKEPRAARTAKMNMIMHGDGHGGIHWHDGLVDISGIFANRFKVVLTNPPFGAIVNSAQTIGATPEIDVPNDMQYRSRQESRYGNAWVNAHDSLVKSRGKKVLELFEIGEGVSSRKTEQLFLERCIRLLEPGGRLGIILPNGNLNASSQAWLRRWAEGKVILRGVISLPSESFRFSGASITASIVIMQKFTSADSQEWERCWSEALRVTEESFAPRRDSLVASFSDAIIHDGDATLKNLLDRLRSYEVDRVVPNPTRSVGKAGLVRGAPSTTVSAAMWTGGSTEASVRTLKREYATRAAQLPRLKKAMTELRASLKALDAEQSSEMWGAVRQQFDYPIFMATPKAVGITATGETGDSVADDLPVVLSAWQRFVADNPWRSE